MYKVKNYARTPPAPLVIGFNNFRRDMLVRDQ